MAYPIRKDLNGVDSLHQDIRDIPNKRTDLESRLPVPKLAIRNASEVPSPPKANRAVLEQQRLYEGYIREAEGNVGELELESDESVRSIKVRLRRAATRMGSKLDIWDINSRVYFQAEAPRRRGRPHKSA